MISSPEGLSSTAMQTASQGFPYLSHTLSTPRLKSSTSRNMTNALVTSGQVKKFTYTDPVMSDVVDIVTRGKEGDLSDNLTY
jgi:hypothetical protein